MPVIITFFLTVIEYLALSSRAAQPMLLPFPAASPGMSEGWRVQSMDLNFLANSWINSKALVSASASLCSIPR